MRPLNVATAPRVLGVAWLGEPFDLGHVGSDVRIAAAPPGVDLASATRDGHMATFAAVGRWTCERTIVQPNGAPAIEGCFVAVFHREARAIRALSHHVHGQPRSDEAVRNILRAVAQENPINHTTRERPIPGVALHPFGADYGQ